jgi:hypothetical protein
MATSLSEPERAAIENALDAAEDFGRYGRTSRVCLTCGGRLAIERVGNSYRILCVSEGRVILASRGL